MSENIATSQKENIRVQRYIVGIAILLFGIKMYAWQITGSVAILTDGIESIVNVVSGFIGLYSLHLSAKPKDSNHPYGHGKVEFISAGIEGTLILIAGIFIIYKALYSLLETRELLSLDTGMIIVSLSAVVNYLFGRWAVKTGEENHSLALEASGRHLITDTYTTVGIVLGLILVRVTGFVWLDALTAIIFGVFILLTAYRILRAALAGIMDETDEALLEDLIDYLEQNRVDSWVDIHNLRIIKYGKILHVDCHLTVPWYFNVKEAHQEVELLEQMVRQKYGKRVELFVHTDYCMDFSCKICGLQDCEARRDEQEKRIQWTPENVAVNEKHSA